MSFDMSQFLEVFYEESFEGLEAMETGFLDLDPNSYDDEELNTIFRAAHSIKGGAGTFGLTDVASYTHVMETLLDQMRNGSRSITAQGIQILLESVDVLRYLLTCNKKENEVDKDRVDAQQRVLEAFLQNQDSQVTAASSAPDETNSAAAPEVANEPKITGWIIAFCPHRDLLQTANDPVRMFSFLEELGELKVEVDLDTLPSWNEFDSEQCYLTWKLTLNGDIELAAIEDVFEWVEDEADIVYRPVVDESGAATPAVEAAAETEQAPPASAPTAKAEPAKKAAKAKTAASSSSIRVGTDKIDHLIDMVGELVITQSMLGMLGEDFNMQKLESLQNGLSQLERHTRELQEAVMRIRMLPISFVFNRFPRLVHDLSAKLNKKIDIRIEGEGTELDKTVIEQIGDPLVHLVRNSLDHGIESPDERLAAGKPETGELLLNAYHKGGSIVIEVSDDGRGLNRDKILAKAIESGIVSPHEDISDDRVAELIFHAGFSTAEQVSDVSGRGVGMDVVRKNIQRLGGNIDVSSAPGQGSLFRIRLPLTLAILDGQSLRVGNETYIVPLASIVESVQLSPDMVKMVAGKGELFQWRDEYLNVVRMHEVLNVESAEFTELTHGILVVVEADGIRCGLFVDELQGQQQVVIKSLEANYHKVPGISGATILGDGSVALILDIPGLIRLATA